MPTVPCGVQVRGGLYFGAVRRERGSSGIRNGRPGQKPSEATQYSRAGMDAHQLLRVRSDR